MTRRFFAVVTALTLVLASVGVAMAATPPANDAPSGAIPLSLDTPLEFDSTDATAGPEDPTTCDGSHGPFPGPYFASVWFSVTAKKAGQLHLSAPTMQGEANDFLAITFIYLQTPSGLELIDCTAFGNDATWEAARGATYLIMEAGLASTTTGEQDFSDRGGHGTIWVSQTSNEHHYAWFDKFTYSDCGFRVDGVAQGTGTFRVRPARDGVAAEYVLDNFNWSVVTTNPANGKWFREDHNGLFRDHEITMDAGIITVVAQETGRPFTLTDMDGNRIYADRGRLLTTFQFDTKGDDDPTNDEFVEGSFALLAENGSHAGFFIEDWCSEVVQPLLG